MYILSHFKTVCFLIRETKNIWQVLYYARSIIRIMNNMTLNYKNSRMEAKIFKRLCFYEIKMEIYIYTKHTCTKHMDAHIYILKTVAFWAF